MINNKRFFTKGDTIMSEKMKDKLFDIAVILACPCLIIGIPVGLTEDIFWVKILLGILLFGGIVTYFVTLAYAYKVAFGGSDTNESDPGDDEVSEP